MASYLRDTHPLRLGRAVLLAFLVLGLAVAGFQQAIRADRTPGSSPVANPCGTFAPGATSILPVNPGNTQVQVDCAAWQAFIAVNWQADPRKPGYPDPAAPWASFGAPGDERATVWESYLGAADVFGGTKPLRGSWQARRPAVKLLSRTSKFGDLDLTSIAQAGSGDHWLTSQRGDVTYYEIRMNQDEYEFITQKNFDLTTAAGQLACASQPGKPVSDGPPIKPPYPAGTVLRGGLNFPVGQANGWDDTDCAGNVAAYGQGVGAMEIKAAWTPLPADHSLDYRYKTAQAEIRDPSTGKTRLVTVGLVGLHIARKRFPKMPWVWATFEQIDNDPDEAANGGFSAPAIPANAHQRPSPGYTFFDPTCTPAKDPTYGCRHNMPPTPCGQGGICMPYDRPMQITRINPVGATANRITAYAWGLMPPRSVFNYYRLIDVQWPQAPLRTPPGPGLRTALTKGDPMPAGAVGGPSQIVADTTLESFQQTSNSCFDCHAFAPIASPKLMQAIGPNHLRRLALTPKGATPPYASDYSFIFLAETKH